MTDGREQPDECRYHRAIDTNNASQRAEGQQYAGNITDAATLTITVYPASGGAADVHPRHRRRHRREWLSE